MGGRSGADSFTTQKMVTGIIVIAATNRAETLDSALLRAGRFDRRIRLSLPDLASRHAILGVHARNKPLEEAVDLSQVRAVGCRVDWGGCGVVVEGLGIRGLGCEVL